MRDAIVAALPHANVSGRVGRGGSFEIVVDGISAHSKLNGGGFPDHERYGGHAVGVVRVPCSREGVVCVCVCVGRARAESSLSLPLGNPLLVPWTGTDSITMARRVGAGLCADTPLCVVTLARLAAMRK